MQVLENYSLCLLGLDEIGLNNSIIFGFLFRKGLLLQLLCIWETWKNLSPEKLFLRKGTNPVSSTMLAFRQLTAPTFHFEFLNDQTQWKPESCRKVVKNE